MKEKIKTLLAKNANLTQFIKYTLFSLIAGLTETILFVVLNYILPAKGINRHITWFIFDYPTQAGGLGALIAFATSAVVGQTVAFITNFKKTFESTNNVFLSAFGYLILALVTIIGIHTYLGGLLNSALCKIIPNTDIAGTLAKVTCQFSGFLLAFPVNKFILMRKKVTPDSLQQQPAEQEEAMPIADNE